jgi:glycosyltransferase involved in cell wall biosynthesis
VTRGADVARVDVIVPTYNNLAELQRCLGSIGPLDLVERVLVCVDGSTDGTLEHLRRAAHDFELVALEHPDGRNHGRAATRNLALPYLRAPFALLLDSDMKLAPGALEGHLAVLRSRMCVSVGAVRYENALQNLWARYLMTRGADKSRPGATVRPLDFVTANSALRTEDLLAVGGFDETLSGYGGEDTELALRLHQRGIDFVFNANSVATTVETKSVAAGLDELRRYGASNLRTTRARHPELPAPYLVDRLESGKLPDRLFAALLNPATDAVVSLLVRIPWFALQRRLLNYKVLRAVWSGYREGGA